MILFRWLFTAGLFLIISRYIPGIEVQSFSTALILAFFWGVVNVLLKPLLIFFTLPLNIVTLGLFLFVINGFLFWFLSTFIKGFEVEGFGYAILGAMILSLGSLIFNTLLKDSKKDHNVPLNSK
ncbi:MAG: phage holin family protein [Candidatus Moraniibacteriota bacterium]|nr:MAG: phage holin family protein [Candidatus Moranbacteria bacterium]